MDYRKAGERIVLRIDEGEEIVQSVMEVCRKESIESALVSGIGALRKAELAHFDTKEKKYNGRVFEGMFEIVSLNGNIAIFDKEPLLHAHMEIADSDLSTYGGHLVQGIVNPTCEILIVALGSGMKREKDGKTGLKMLRFE